MRYALALTACLYAIPCAAQTSVGSTQQSVVTPTGNQLPTMTNMTLQQESQSTNLREYMVNMGFKVGTGLSGNPVIAGQDKAGLYFGVTGHAAAGNLWSTNLLLTLGPTMQQTSGHHQVLELDLGNSLHPVDPTPGPNGMQYPAATTELGGQQYDYGLIVENAGDYASTAAIVVDGSMLWHRGIGIGSATGSEIDQVGFFDYSNSPTVFDVWGRHSMGISFANAAMSGPLLQGVGIALEAQTTDHAATIALAAGPAPAAPAAGTFWIYIDEKDGYLKALGSSGVPTLLAKP